MEWTKKEWWWLSHIRGVEHFRIRVGVWNYSYSMSRMSYANAASAKKPVTFRYQEDIPSSKTITTKTRSVSLIANQAAFGTETEANRRFSQGDACLDGLDTSGDLTQYVVSVADGKRVLFRHQDDVVTVTNKLVFIRRDLMQTWIRDTKTLKKKERHYGGKLEF